MFNDLHFYDDIQVMLCFKPKKNPELERDIKECEKYDKASKKAIKLLLLGTSIYSVFYYFMCL